MLIAHVSDIHIRNLKFHQDYRRVFDDFYAKLKDMKVDLVVNTGDTAHTKTVISPEFVSMAGDFFTRTADCAPMINVLGNHDLNLMNEDRQDAISPIVTALNNPRVILVKKSGKFVTSYAPGFAFWNLGISDVGNWPHPPYPKDEINIGMFHGSVRNCVTDSLFRMTNVEYDHDIFDGLDFVFMGDIHKRQEFNSGRARYAGSMIQQNFGEDTDKGFLLWDIRGKDDFNVCFHELHGARKFYTVKLPDTLVVPEMNIEQDSRVRISPPRQITLVEQKAIEKIVKKKWSPHDVITLGAHNIGQMFTDVGTGSTKIENLRDVTVQEQLLRMYLEPRKLHVDMMNRIIDLNRKYQVVVNQKDTVARGVNWRVLKMGWSNLYNYGEGNVVDFSHIKGLTGVFAPNAAGKSGMIDVLAVGAWDSNTKEVTKNVHLVNDNKDNAIIILELLANNERYTITRQIERIKQPQKNAPDKEWGKTTLDFVHNGKDGSVEKLVGELRPQTESNIRRRIGTFEDFMLTGLFAQWDPQDIIVCKETDRKRILFRFLDLDIFEEKAKLAKDDFKEWAEKLADLEESGYERIFKELKVAQDEDANRLAAAETSKDVTHDAIRAIHEKIECLSRQIVPVTFMFRKIERAFTDDLERRFRASHATLGTCERKVADSEHAVSLATVVVASYDDDLIQRKVARLEMLESNVKKLAGVLQEKARDCYDAKSQLVLLGKVPCGDKFPTCQFLVNAFDAKNRLPDINAAGDAASIEIASITSEIVLLEKYRDEQEKQAHAISELNSCANELRISKLEFDNAKLNTSKLSADIEQAKLEFERYEQVRRDLDKNTVVNVEIVDEKRKLGIAEETFKKIETGISALHQKMGARDTDMGRIKKQLDTIKDVRDTCSAFEHFIDAMGKDGIALRVLTQKLPLINEEINKILGSACEFGVYIEYDKEDQNIRLFIQYGQYKSRLLELGSGAEKFLASVAIRSALLNISNLPRSNMFIIDEGFGKLDSSNIEAIQHIFDYLKSVFDHVIIISHTDVMKDLVDNIIDITTDDDGYAHVEVGG